MSSFASMPSISNILIFTPSNSKQVDVLNLWNNNTTREIVYGGDWLEFVETGRGSGKIPFGLQVDNKETKFHIKRTIPVEIRTTRLNKKMTDIVICAECC